MSHKKMIRTEYKDKDVLAEALQAAAAQCGFVIARGTQLARMYSGEELPVDFRIARNRSDYDGFFYGDFGMSYQSDGTFRIIIDDLDIQRPKVQMFLDTVAQQYAYKATLKTLAAQGYAVTEQRQADGTIKLIARPTRRTTTRQSTRPTATRQTATVRR